MNAVLIALGIVVTPIVLVLGLLALDGALERRADEKRRREQDRLIDAEWLSVLAAEETTPIFDALMCEQIERAEGWL